MATKKIGITYEENIDKIDEIIEKLENSELSLDESITEYEKAIKLIKESEKLFKRFIKPSFLLINVLETILLETLS